MSEPVDLANPAVPEFEEALRGLVRSFPGLSNLNVVWGERPQGQALPALVCQVVSDPIRRSSFGYTGEHSTRVQMEAWAASYLAARSITRALIRHLDGWKGTHMGVHFAGVFVLDGDSGFEDTGTGVIHRSRIDVSALSQPVEE